MITPIVEFRGVDDASLRASAMSAQVVGLVMARDVVALEPLASITEPQLAGTLGLVFQLILLGPLPEA